MKVFKPLLFLVLVGLLFAGCGGAEKPKLSGFLTLADLTGRTNLKEDSPDVRVINVKAKAYIKENNLRAAREMAMQSAAKLAVDEMVQELTTPELYNKSFAEVDNYFSKNIDNYIVDQEVMDEKKILLDQFYGVHGSFKVSRQKVLVALQKDLRLIDTSLSTLITVITSNKDLDLSKFNFQFKDIEESLNKQVQTKLNQKGLRAMDYRVAVTSFAADDKRSAEYRKLSKEQFVEMMQGSKDGASSAAADADAYYKGGMTLLKQLARVVVEINVQSVSKTGENMGMNVMVSAVNISSPTGGAFATSQIPVARRGSGSTDDAMMLGALVKDAADSISDEFIPQVVKEMSSIDAGGGKMLAYDLVFQGFDSAKARGLRNAIKRENSDNFRYIDYNNELSQLEVPISIVYVRFLGKPSSLADKVMEVMDGEKIKFEEPIVAPKVRDLVFVAQPE
ncbi:MAG: hypothetical protein A2527_11500 [Candidatus Lambdaproteobacteria bacterium RIFOXYD2_FULL_50_16]|uniref:Uncharacterized protein n=1 Tax=Candidatus Lambdaproteobacteria bacterium RIFOXYD2_FULL_50_16 TaxID=1817772 RepID=A0A1F6G6M3_9PROT|nr:MAG: hypothetical protein A2527_11500 [Candidatus Lambdaproteobacteria bacterium RIFOXYD2_FULL_50_16]